jgi:hypothetical protein
MLGSGLHCIVCDDCSGPSDRLLASPQTIPGPPLASLRSAYPPDLYKVHDGYTQEANTEPAPTPNVYLSQATLLT